MVTRFAPSPTGYLHLGHVVNAIYVWGLARHVGARVLLRIEDHDRIRCRPEYERAILEDLAWLGFRADEPPVRQSDRSHVYAGALAQLRQKYHVYVCDCSRKQIRQDLGGKAGEDVYSGRCRTRHLDEAPGRGLRLEECGDLLIRDRDGNWTYQFCVTVDDLTQGVDLVIRGDDLRASTDRQLQLARMLGRTGTPRFIHHPLLLKPSGEKLSKAAGDTGVREMREAGRSPEEVIGAAAAAVGLLATARPLAASDVGHLFRESGLR